MKHFWLSVSAVCVVAAGIALWQRHVNAAFVIATVGVLCGGFTEDSLRQAGCAQVYPGPAALLACFGDSLLAK